MNEVVVGDEIRLADDPVADAVNPDGSYCRRTRLRPDSSNRDYESDAAARTTACPRRFRRRFQRSAPDDRFGPRGDRRFDAVRTDGEAFVAVWILCAKRLTTVDLNKPITLRSEIWLT
jgi:hypothetical protein